MARTINEMARDRRSALKTVRRQLKDTIVDAQKSMRRIDRIMERRSKIPEISDLDQLTIEYMEIQKEFDEYTKSVGDALMQFTLI